MDSIRDSFESTAEKQELLSTKLQDMINQVGSEIVQALARMQSTGDSTVAVDHKTVLTDLNDNLQAAALLTELEQLEEELETNLSRYEKTLEKAIRQDISKAFRDVDYDHHVLNEIIIRHFYSEGMFDIVDCLVKEAGEPEFIPLRLQYQELHQILDGVKCKNLEQAYKWVASNRERLYESGSDLELKLHKLQLIDILQTKGGTEALRHARTYIPALASRHMNEIKRLNCNIVWARKLDKSPYPDLADPANWEKFSEELKRTFCNFVEQPSRDPLSVTVAAGMEGLPTLLRLADVMGESKQEWEAMEQLPVPLELGKEFQFHSIFVCQVTPDRCVKINPPMLFPCGHVLGWQTITLLKRSKCGTIKCPYCAKKCRASQCKVLKI